METVRSAIAAVTSSEPEMKRLFRLRASVNEYDWGKVGAASLAARLAPEGVGSDFKIDPSKCYSEVCDVLFPPRHPLTGGNRRCGWARTRPGPPPSSRAPHASSPP